MVMAAELDLDKLLLEKISKGDWKAFSLVFEKNYHLMYAIAIKYLKDKDAAMDAVQNTFIKLWEKRSEFIQDTNLRNLLYTILKNGIVNEIRDNRLHYEKLYLLAQQEAETAYEPYQESHRDKYIKLLYEKIGVLPPKQKAVCELKLKHNLTNMEIAERLGIALPTVKVHYYKALKTLRKLKNESLAITLLILLISLSVYL